MTYSKSCDNTAELSRTTIDTAKIAFIALFIEFPCTFVEKQFSVSN